MLLSPPRRIPVVEISRGCLLPGILPELRDTELCCCRFVFCVKQPGQQRHWPIRLLGLGLVQISGRAEARYRNPDGVKMKVQISTTSWQVGTGSDFKFWRLAYY